MMIDDEDILDTNRPEPDEYPMGKPHSSVVPNENFKGELGIKRSLIYTQSTKIKDVRDRISYLKKELTKYRQGITNPFEFYDEYDFDKCISLEIEYLEEESKRSEINDNQNKFITEYDHKLISEIYKLCIKYDVFSYTFLDYIKYIETAHFEIDDRILNEKKFRHLIYTLRIPLSKPWYKLVVKHSGIPIKRFGGLRTDISPDFWLDELDKLVPEPPK